jgi:hypothetical protein
LDIKDTSPSKKNLAKPHNSPSNPHNCHQFFLIEEVTHDMWDSHCCR